jgi:hypothetical protein
LFAFAGLWDRWKDPSGGWIKTCSILTTAPNAVTSPVHDRMPVILDPDGYDLWLDPGMRDAGAASELLKPFDARLMRCYPVSTRINQVANDDKECSAPVELAQTQARLFCRGVEPGTEHSSIAAGYVRLLYCKLPVVVIGLPIASPDTTSSTLRFCCRPAALSFVATGKVLPKPFALTEFVATPCCTR